MRSVAVWLLLALLLVVAPSRAAPTRAPIPVKATLDNGLTVVVEENHNAPIVTLQAWVKFGSREEDDTTNGGAHFIEHMLFKGTTRRTVGQIDREVEGLGGILNASTWFDYTWFYIVAASRFFERILAIQSDALMNSTFDPEEFERERKVIIEELNRRDDTPATRTFDMIYPTAFTTHPYRRPIGGSRDVINRMTRDQLFTFYKTNYVPGDTTVVVVGDISADDVIARVRRALGSWRGPERTRSVFPAEPAATTVRRAALELDVRVGYIRMGWVGPGVRDHDVYAMDVLLYALSRGRVSRLIQSVQDRQRLVSGISASFPTGVDPLLFTIAGTVEPQNLAAAERAILAEITSVRDEGISDEELRRAKTLLEGQTVQEHHTSRGRAEELGYYATIAGVEFALTYLDRVRQVTREDVQRAARQYLDPQRYAVVTIRPRGQAR